MTSALRRFAQMDPHSSSYILLSTLQGWTPKPGVTPSSLMDLNVFKDSFDNLGYTPTSQFSGNTSALNTGRQITIYDGSVAGSPHVALFREIQFFDTVNADPPALVSFYICVKIFDCSRDLGFGIAAISIVG